MQLGSDGVSRPFTFFWVDPHGTHHGPLPSASVGISVAASVAREASLWLRDPIHCDNFTEANDP